MGRPPGPVRTVTPSRRLVLQVLTTRGDEWLSARAVHEEAGLRLGHTHETLRVLTLLGWVRITVDRGKVPRPGGVGRKTRRHFQVTEAGLAALHASEGDADG